MLKLTEQVARIFRHLWRWRHGSWLADAELSMLAAMSAQEYAASVVSYDQQRITRLRAYIAAEGSKKC